MLRTYTRIILYEKIFRELNFRGLRPMFENREIMRLDNLALYGMQLHQLPVQPWPSAIVAQSISVWYHGVVHRHTAHGNVAPDREQ